MIQAVILAGGLGTRLRVVLGDLPKPMAPICGRPFLEHQLLAFKRSGIDRFVLCVGYRAETISDYFGDGSRWGIRIGYSVESTPLGTAGALKHAERLLENEFLVLNGDTFLELDYTELVRYHRKRGTQATIAVTAVDGRQADGNVELNDESQVTAFSEERVARDGAHYSWINAGIYVFQRPILARVPESRPVSLEKETFPLLLAQGEPISAYVVSGYFMDIGTPGNYFRFERDIREGQAHVDSQ